MDVIVTGQWANICNNICSDVSHDNFQNIFLKNAIEQFLTICGFEKLEMFNNYVGYKL